MSATEQLRQTKGRAVLAEEAARVEAQRVTRAYEWHRFTVPALVTGPTSVRTVVNHVSSCSCGRASGAFGLVSYPGRVSLTNQGGATLYVYLDVATADAIAVDPGREFGWADCQFTDLFVRNPSGSPIDVDLGLR